MSLPDQEDVLSSLQEVLGEHLLITRDDVRSYEQNVTALDVPVTAVARPGTVKQLQQVVQIAAENKLPLYPISKGLNWGLGSRLPVAKNSLVVDMGRMNHIVAINPGQQYAIVEPGVTQGQLYRYLQEQGLPLTFNVTGSGVDASLIGNALDRGVGYRSVRAEDVLGLEVVTGAAEVIQTGFGRYESAETTGHYPYGIGPALDGLFFQSGMGIVTKAYIRLYPKQEQECAVLCSLTDESRLKEFLDAVAWLRKHEVLQSVIHVGNRARTKVTLLPLLEEVLEKEQKLTGAALHEAAISLFDTEMRAAWTALASLSGTRLQVEAAVKVIRQKLAGFGKVTVVDQQKINSQRKLLKKLSFMASYRKKSYLAEALTPLLGLPLGIPSDVAIKGVYWVAGESQPAGAMQPDKSNAGLKFILPTAPLEGKAGKKVVDITETVCSTFGFTPYITLNTITSRSFGCVINISFNRADSKEVEKAKDCANTLLDRLMDKGFYPYRVGVDQMKMVVDPDKPYWQTMERVKSAMDPEGIIAPGKYSIV